MYPVHGDPEFADKLVAMKEYQIYKAPKYDVFASKDTFENQVTKSCSTFEKSGYQHFVQHYLSRRSPYKSVILYHGLGVGKTCSAITVAESLLLDHTAGEGPRVIVVSSAALQKSFEDQLFSMSRFLAGKSLLDQCTGDLYKKLVHGTKDNDAFRRKLNKVIRSRYLFLTYDKLPAYFQDVGTVKNKVIIVDEVHNLRQLKTEKASAKALEQMVTNGEGNRLVLLTATPMYNEPDEIFWLLDLVLRNDKREPLDPKLTLFKKTGEANAKTFALLEQLASEYVSYIKGGNPFTMPVRISPKLNGMKTLSGVAELQSIQDFVVPVNAGAKQKLTLKRSEKVAEEGNEENLQSLQILNAYYPAGKTGTKGFSSVFANVDDKEPLQVVYNKRYNDYLLPYTNLPTVAPKIQSIIDAINNSTGIIIVYSQFVYGGILPVAVALEHMGCTRFAGRNVCRGLNVATESRIVGRSYAIISGDRHVMGAAHIDDILATVNSDGNMDGSRVKVVLITPIAGEGLNFKNVRELHVLDPWYHMNRIEQVIGRAARTCSHSMLPLEQRNVTIYLHACTSANGDTADIHAYKIAVRKLMQTLETEKTIRNAALDCSLMYHLNYYAKSLFPFVISMMTSQNRQIQYQYGDSDDAEPNCKHAPKGAIKTTTYRKDLYSGLVATNEKKILKMLEKGIERGDKYFTIQNILDALKVEPEIAFMALKNVATYGPVKMHLNYLVYDAKKKPTPVTEIAVSSIQSDEQEATSAAPTLPAMMNDPVVDTIMLYLSIDSKSWSSIAMEMLAGKHAVAAALMAKQGALVMKSELPKIQSAFGTQYIGYCDIFDVKKLSVTLCPAGSQPRVATDAEVRQIKTTRTEIKPNNDELYGMLYPNKFSKDGNQPYVNKLKIFTPGVKTRGAMCEPKKVNELSSILEELTGRKVDLSGKTRYQACFTISSALFRNAKLFMFPLWKNMNT